MDDSEKRMKATAVVNTALADVRTAEKRLEQAQEEMRRRIEQARVEIGTARRELAKRVEAYDVAKRDVAKLMPAVDYPPDFVELMVEFGSLTKLLAADEPVLEDTPAAT